MWKFLLAGKDGKVANFEAYRLGDVTKYALSITSTPQIFGVFKTYTNTIAGTFTVASPPVGGALVLTDLLVSTDKTIGSVTVNFTDGVRTETILKISTSDAPANIAHSFAGKWEGWQDAYIQIIVVGAVVQSTAVGYYKVQQGKQYADWNSLR